MLGNGHSRGIIMPGKFQGLLVVSPVTRVRSVGLFLVKLCFLEIKALWQFQLQVYTEREKKNLQGAF